MQQMNELQHHRALMLKMNLSQQLSGGHVRFLISEWMIENLIACITSVVNSGNTVEDLQDLRQQLVIHNGG